MAHGREKNLVVCYLYLNSMYCDNCGGQVEDFNFCPQCGEAISSGFAGIAPCIRNNLSEEEAIRFYFGRSFQYYSILNFLSKFHNIGISYRTLLNRLNEYGLRRRNQNVDELEVRRLIANEMDGAGNSVGYRMMWQTIRTKYEMNVPRALVQRLIREIDPEGSDTRRRRCLRRRAFFSQGPNFSWHADGCDKLKHFGFPIHGCIDGYSRRVLWLKVGTTNNNSNFIAHYYLQAVETLGGCPKLCQTDRGTENTIMAGIQRFFRRNGNDELSGEKAHRYGSSVTNQRIESWWAQLKKSWASWWIEFFQKLREDGEFDTSEELQKQCIYFSFQKVIQNELDDVRNRWNTHYIRRSRHNTEAGIPDEMFFLPESFNTTDYKEEVADEDLFQMKQQLVLDENANIYFDYFTETSSSLPNRVSNPTTWRGCLNLYRRLLEIAQGQH